MTDVTITTNNVPRFTIDPHELTDREREDFDYLDWDAIDRGEDSATFVRYLGRVYDLGEFMCVSNPWQFPDWQGIAYETSFSGVLVKYVDDETVVMASYYA